MSGFRSFLVSLTLVLLVGGTLSPVIAADVEMSLGTGYLYGYTQYQIGGHVSAADGSQSNFHFPISELKFPLDSVMGQLEVNISFSEKLALKLKAQTNITDDTGKMEDSDWLVVPSQLDIFSESDTEMRAWLGDATLKYTFGQTHFASGRDRSDGYLASYTAGLGFKYQKYNFDVSNVLQWYPSSPSTPADFVAGLVLKYEAEYMIPYLELGMEIQGPNKGSGGFSVGFIPVLHFEDEDQHLLRDKVNVADHGWTGYGWFVKAEGRYNLNGSWYLSGDLSWLMMESSGVSDASFGGVYDHSIDHEIKSSQASLFVNLGYDF